jgi:ketosteroid isomerase-like protein
MLVLFMIGEAVNAGAQSQALEARAGIDRGNAAFVKAYQMGDPVALAAVFDENGSRFLQGGVRVRGNAAIRLDAVEEFRRLGTPTVAIYTEDVWVMDGVAYETGTFTFTIRPSGGEPEVLAGRHFVTWREQTDGSWKMWTEMSVPIDPSCAPAGSMLAHFMIPR